MSVHEAAEPQGRQQLCSRCGFVLLASRALGGFWWPVGASVEVSPGDWDEEHALVESRPNCKKEEESA